MCRREDEEDDDDEDYTKAPEQVFLNFSCAKHLVFSFVNGIFCQVFSYDPSQVISVAAPPVAPPLARASSILKKNGNGGERQTLPREERAEMVPEERSTIQKQNSLTKENAAQNEDMEMTMGVSENTRTRLGHEVSLSTRDRETVSPDAAQTWDRTTVQRQDMEMTKMMYKTTEEGVAAIERERSPKRTQPWNKTSIQGEDMEMTRAAGKTLGDRTSVNQENMEMTKVVPQIFIEGPSLDQRDDMEMTRAAKGSAIQIMPATSPCQEEVAAEESGWETMHSPIISVSPVLPTQPSKAPGKSQAELLRENFPSPVSSPSPEATCMLGGMPIKPKAKAGIWDGDVTSFMPVGESTRAIKIRLPAASIISPTCSPLARPESKMEVGELTSFAPGEEYESTRKLPSVNQLPRPDYESLRKIPAGHVQPSSSLKSPSLSPLPTSTVKEVGGQWSSLTPILYANVLDILLFRWAI